jgi:hypothetical protein
MRLALALILISSVASADRADPPPPPARSSGPTAGAPAAEMAVVPPPPRRPRPPPPPVPGDIAIRGKQLAGTYTCKGTRLVGDGSSKPMQAKLAIKLDLDNAWIAATWSGDVRMIEYRTFDATSKQWSRFILASDTSHQTLTSIGEKSGEWLWEGAESSQTGTLQYRHHETLDKKTLKLYGEVQLGGTWQKAYEATCAR